ncbi:four helix bundle protein [Variovorax paradoxus]|uniref:four helix bundle protein n=1 Tax=Variovorax paradoxus TaxID=34073 RepID=UPI003AAE2BF2
MALYTELPIYRHGCDLLSLALDVQTQMPRIFKRSLGEKIHALCVEMLEAMAMANACRGAERLQQLDNLLRHLRATTAMLRVSHDKRLISLKLWSASVELLDAVGSQAGGWRKQTLSTLSAAPAA